MLDTVFGLPVHPLIVHATVVIVPSAALAVLLSALWPRFRDWAGWAPLSLAVTAVVLAPLSTSSGEPFEKLVGESKLIEEHSHLGDLLIWWVTPLALVAAVGYWLYTFRGGQPQRQGRGVSAIVSALSVVATVGTLVMVVLIGHSGAKAAWSDAGASETTTVAVSTST